MIGVSTLLLLAALMPTAVIAFAALDGVTEADDAVQRASENDNMEAASLVELRNMV